MTNREKQMIGVVGVLLLLLVLYYVGYRPLTNKKAELEEEVASLTTTADELRKEYVKMAEYQAGIDASKATIAEIDAKYPSGLDQELGFELIFAIEDRYEGVLFDTMNFAPVEPLMYSEENVTENTLRGLRQTLTSDMMFDYGDLKDFLKFIVDYPKKTVLTSLNMSLDESTGKINTSISLNQYAIEGADRVYEAPVFDEVPTGNDILFDSENLLVDIVGPSSKRPKDADGNVIRDAVSDIYIALKPTQADVEAQVIGLRADQTQSSYVRQDINDIVEATIRIYSSGDAYFADFILGDVDNGSNTFEVGNILEIEVNASDRVGDDDLAGMNLTIDNETDMVLYINHFTDDDDNPRLTFGSITGEVIIDE